MTSQFYGYSYFGADSKIIGIRQLVEDAIADGKLTISEMNSIRNALMADGKLTLEEVELVRDVMRQKLGDAPLEFETSGEVPSVSDLLL